MSRHTTTINLPVTRLLSQNGLRPTRQREVVYRTLLGQRDHPTADEVFSRVKTVMPTISLATVYNCLDALVHCRLVRQVNFEREPSRYCPNLQEHAHFHDKTTGRTYDIPLDPGLLNRLHATLPEGFAVEAVELSFRGTAPTESQSTP